MTDTVEFKVETTVKLKVDTVNDDIVIVTFPQSPWGLAKAVLRKDFEKKVGTTITGPASFKEYKFPGKLRKGNYARLTKVSLEEVEAFKNGRPRRFMDKGETVWLWSDENFRLYEIDGTPILAPIGLSQIVLNRDYDIYSIIEAAKTDPTINVVGNPYYVSGNGMTLNVSFRVSAEEYAEYLLLDWNAQSRFEREKLARWKRPEPLDEDYDD